MTNATQIEQDIDAILSGLGDDGETFIATRYPFTYAYDFARQHPAQFGFVPEALSRAEASGQVRAYAERTGQQRVDVIVALADAYLTKWHVNVTQAQKDAAMAHARREYWKAFGLPKPTDD